LENLNEKTMLFWWSATSDLTNATKKLPSQTLMGCDYWNQEKSNMCPLVQWKLMLRKQSSPTLHRLESSMSSWNIVQTKATKPLQLRKACEVCLYKCDARPQVHTKWSQNLHDKPVTFNNKSRLISMDHLHIGLTTNRSTIRGVRLHKQYVVYLGLFQKLLL